MQQHKYLFIFIFIFIFFSTTFFDISHANPILTSISHSLQNTITNDHQWWSQFLHIAPIPNLQFLIAGILSFIAGAISSAGGIGGGGLFIPILTIIAGLELKTATSFSAFMVTGGSMANVACQFFVKRGSKPLINYDIALLSEPFMLLGVSLGVICNLMLPEWLIIIFFAMFIAFCTFKTCKSGVGFWRVESEGMQRKIEEEDCDGGGINQPLRLLSSDFNEEDEIMRRLEIPWMKIGMLVVIWFTFFVLYLLRGNRYGQVSQFYFTFSIWIFLNSFFVMYYSCLLI